MGRDGIFFAIPIPSLGADGKCHQSRRPWKKKWPTPVKSPGAWGASAPPVQNVVMGAGREDA